MIITWIKRSIFLVFTGFLVLGTILQLSNVREMAKEYLIETIEFKTGYTVNIDDLKLFPSFQITARNVTVFDKDSPLIELDHLHLGIYPLDLLLKGKFHFSTLHVEGARFQNIPKENELSSQTGEKELNIAIDDLFVEGIDLDIPEIASLDFPLTLRGSVIADLMKYRFYSNFKILSLKFPGQSISGDFSFENSKGSLLLKKDKYTKTSLEFEIEDQTRIHIPHFIAKWESYSVDGKFSLSTNGDIEESIFYLVVNDLSKSTPLSGALFGEVVVSGNIMLPKIDLSLISDSITGYDHKIENVKLRLSTAKKGTFDFSFTKNDYPYNFSSTLSWDQKTPWFPTQLDLRVPLQEVAQLVNWDVADIDGQLLIHTRYQNGALKLRTELIDGIFESFVMGSRFANIHAVVEGDLKTLRLTQFSAVDTENGNYQGSGVIHFEQTKEFPFAFTWNLENTHPFQSDIVQSALSGSLTFSGNISEASLSGDLRVMAPQIRIPEKLPESDRSIKVTYINQDENEPLPTQPEHFSFEWPISLDVNIAIADRLAIKGKGLSSIWNGKINVGGTLIKPKTKGELKLDNGRFLFRGKNFEFKQGSVTFNGDPEKNTQFFLTAEADLTDLTVQTVLKGPILNPSITLTSSPPMSQRAILSWLLFGKGIAEINPMEETQLSRSLRSLLDNVDDKPDLLTRMGDVLGLDQVEIGTSSTGQSGDLTVSVGKYLTEGTYLSISRNISRGKDADKNSSCFGIETRLGRHLRFRAEGDTETNGRLNLLWKNEY